MVLGAIARGISTAAKAAKKIKDSKSSSSSSSSRSSSSSSSSRSSSSSNSRSSGSSSSQPTSYGQSALYDKLYESFQNLASNSSKPSTPTTPTVQTPANTGSTSSSINPYNEIEYLKKQYDSGNKVWAANEAKKYYAMLDDDEADKVRNMNAAQLAAYRQTLNKPTQSPTGTTLSDIFNSMKPEVPQEPQLSQSDMMLNDWMQQQQNIYNPQSGTYDPYRDIADREAQQWYDEQKRQLDLLVKQFQDGQSAQLMGINSGVQDAEQALEDRSFQDWLAARQAMADRGLAGSGLASDQDTRLLLAKQRNLSGIYRDAEQQQFQVNSSAARQLEDIYRQISGLSKEGKESELFQGMFSEAQKNMVEQSKTYADMLKEIMGYDRVPAADLAKLENERWITNQNNLMDKYKTDKNFQVDMTNLGLKEREIGIAALKADRDYSVQLSEQMGYLVGTDGRVVTDANGQRIPTVEKQRLDETVRSNMAGENLEGAKLQETIRHNMAGEQYDYDKMAADVTKWAEENKLESRRLNISEQDLKRKTDMDKAVIAEMSQNATTAQQKIQIDGIGKSLNSVNKEIEALRKAGKDVPESLANQRNKLIDELQSVANSNISNGKGTSNDPLDFIP